MPLVQKTLMTDRRRDDVKPMRRLGGRHIIQSLIERATECLFIVQLVRYLRNVSKMNEKFVSL